MKTERCSVCGQGSWCNWCNGCLSFLLCCHSLMTRPSSSGSLWQNTGTRSAGRRLSDSAASTDAVLPPVRPRLPQPCPFLPSCLVCLFVWHLFVARVYLVPLNYCCWPFLLCQRILYSVKSLFLAGGPIFYKWRLKWGQEGENQLVAWYFHVAFQVFFYLHLSKIKFTNNFYFKRALFQSSQTLEAIIIHFSRKCDCFANALRKVNPFKISVCWTFSDGTEWWPYVPSFWERSWDWYYNFKVNQKSHVGSRPWQLSDITTDVFL